MITGEMLKKIIPNMDANRAAEIAAHIVSAGKYYKIDTPDVLHEFIASVAHESGGFRFKDESLNYSSKRLMQVWPKHFNAANAKEYAFNAEKLANKIYGTGSIAKSLGNYKPELGYLRRGAGFMMLTGETNHSAYANFVSMPIEECSRSMRESDIMAIDSAMWFYAVKAKLIPLSKGDSIVQVSVRVNGGLIGFDDRLKYYTRAKEWIK